MMEHAAAIRQVLARRPVVAVLTVARVEDAPPLARALVAGGLDVLEVALRTPCALDAIRAMSAAVPDAVVGAGTLASAAEVVQARRAGARFAVSPGFAPELAAAARDADLPYLPGVMTPSEVMAARAAGFTSLKFFPAREAGGAAMLRALAGPFSEVMFCPTGGVTAGTAPEYLALPNVACVGGSWVAPADRVAAGDWAAIEALARQAAALPRAGLAR